jgi:hypothetical protein
MLGGSLMDLLNQLIGGVEPCFELHFVGVFCFLSSGECTIYFIFIFIFLFFIFKEKNVGVAPQPH